MNDRVQIGEGDAGFIERVEHAERLVVRRGQGLDHPRAAIAAVDQQQIGKGPADIDPGDHLDAGLLF